MLLFSQPSAQITVPAMLGFLAAPPSTRCIYSSGAPLFSMPQPVEVTSGTTASTLGKAAMTSSLKCAAMRRTTVAAQLLQAMMAMQLRVPTLPSGRR